MRFPDKKKQGFGCQFRVFLRAKNIGRRRFRLVTEGGTKNNLSAKNPLLSLKRKGGNIINGLIMCEPERVT